MAPLPSFLSYFFLRIIPFWLLSSIIFLVLACLWCSQFSVPEGAFWAMMICLLEKQWVPQSLSLNGLKNIYMPPPLVHSWGSKLVTTVFFGEADPSKIWNQHAMGVEEVSSAVILKDRPKDELFIQMPSGAKMPANGLGMCCRTPAYDFEAVRRQVHLYIREGGRHIDTADLYMNHLPISLALHEAMLEQNEGGYGLSRSDFFVTTKIFPRHFGRDTIKKRVRSIVRGSGFPLNVTAQDMKNQILAKKMRSTHLNSAKHDDSLHMEYADLVLMHMPINQQQGMLPFGRELWREFGMSPECKKRRWTNLECREQTWLGLSELIDEGVIKDAGVSNFMPKHIQELIDMRQKMSIARIACNQFMYNPWSPPPFQETYDICQKNGIPVVAYGSLGMTMQKKEAENIAIIQSLSKKHAKSPQQILLRWAIQKGINFNEDGSFKNATLGVIPGTSKSAHMRANLEIYDFVLEKEDMNKLGEVKDAQEAEQFYWQVWPEWA